MTTETAALAKENAKLKAELQELNGTIAAVEQSERHHRKAIAQSQAEFAEFPQHIKLVARRDIMRSGKVFNAGDHIATLHLAEGLTLNQFLDRVHDEYLRAA